MTEPPVFLLYVDNTPLDNDRIIAALREHLERDFGVASSARSEHLQRTLKEAQADRAIGSAGGGEEGKR